MSTLAGKTKLLLGTPVSTDRIAARYTAHRVPLLARLTRLVGADEAEDLCRDFFVRVPACGGVPTTTNDQAAWLPREALRPACAAQRRRTRERRANELVSSRVPEDAGSAALDSLNGQVMLALFAEEDRQLLALQVLGDARQTGIAGALGCSFGASRTQLYRLRLRHRDAAPHDVAARADVAGSAKRAGTPRHQEAHGGARLRAAMLRLLALIEAVGAGVLEGWMVLPGYGLRLFAVVPPLRLVDR